MPNEQTNSQRRFTVIQLPVFSIVRQSLTLPFKYLPELVKYGAIPFLVSLAVDAVSFFLEREDFSLTLINFLMATSHFILFTPFAVTWTTLAILGRPSISRHPPFAYTRTQWMYLLATFGLVVMTTIIVGPPAVLVLYGQRTLDNRITVEGSTLLIASLFVFAILYFRLAFIFPAIAVGRFAGIAAAWKQTAGNVERIAAIVFLAYVPFYIVRTVFERMMGYHPPGLLSVIRGIGEMLLVALATTALAGPALAYKTIVLDEPQNTSTPAVAAITPPAGA